MPAVALFLSMSIQEKIPYLNRERVRSKTLWEDGSIKMVGFWTKLAKA
jgi:hypothetical protein